MSQPDAQGSTLTAAQIERLQNLIRHFKALGARFGESQIPALIEQFANKTVGGEHVLLSQGGIISSNPMSRPTTGPTHHDQQEKPTSHAPPTIQRPVGVGQSLSRPMQVMQPPMTQRSMSQTQQPTQTAVQQQPQQTPSNINPPPSGVNQQATVPSLSWQCYHSLLALGCGKLSSDGANSLMPADLGCFTKGAHLPLVSTIPSSISMMDNLLCSAAQPQLDVAKLALLQYSLQTLVASKLTTSIPSGALLHAKSDDMIDAYRLYYNTRRQRSRDAARNREREEKKRRQEDEDRRRPKINNLHKQLMDHREAFLKYHKQRRADLTKVVRATKAQVESLESKRSREEEKAEMRRLQALKENDMEAYKNLVQETKNSRLKFLLLETENYIDTIKQLIQQQRTGDEGDADKSESAVSKNYYNATHRMTEIVTQPRLLKGGDLKEYQLAGLQWLISLYNNNLNGILADEMGLGKTIQTISLLAYLMEIKHNNGPFLVVVPLSTLSNWVNEFNKWAPDIAKVVYKGTPDDRKRIYKEEVEPLKLNVLLTTYEYIMRDKSSLRKLFWQYIIVDEGHRMKNASSKFAQTLGSNYQSKHRILLTGTPLQNNLPELWALLNFLLPSIFSSVDTFDQWFNKPFAAFRNQAAAEDPNGEVDVLTEEERMLIVHRLHEVLRPFMLRRVKDQVLDQLPDKVEKVLRCTLSGWQRKMYRLITRMGLRDGDKEITSGGLNNTIMQLRKVCNHPYLFLSSHHIDDDMIRASGKFELLDRMLPKLREAGHRVLIFSQMVEVISLLEDFFIYRGFRFLRLDGKTPPDEREKRMYTFNDPDSPYFIFLLSTRAGGLGLNLATADTVIIFDSDWNPMMDAQAQDRAHRIGQKNEVRVFRLLTNSAIEERILARANDKRNLNGLVVEAGKFNSRNAGALDENKEMMEALREWTAGGADTAGEVADDEEGGTGGAGGGGGDADVPDDEQLNEMMAAYEGEMELYQKIDEANRSKAVRSALMGAQEMPYWMVENAWLPASKQLMHGMLLAEGEKPRKLQKRPRDDLGEGSVDGDDQSLEVNATRKRKEVVYNDGLTDLQFQRMVDQQMADEEKQKLEAKQAARSAKAAKLGDLPEVYVGLVSVLQDVQKVKAGGVLVAQLFMEKPSKKLYPDYYTMIDQPISLKEIIKNLRAQKYDFLEELELDLALMSHNARTFNGDPSPVFQCSETIRKEFYQRAAKVLVRAGVVDGPLDCPVLPAYGYVMAGYENKSLQTPLVPPSDYNPKKRRKI